MPSDGHSGYCILHQRIRLVKNFLYFCHAASSIPKELRRMIWEYLVGRDYLFTCCDGSIVHLLVDSIETLRSVVNRLCVIKQMSPIELKLVTGFTARDLWISSMEEHSGHRKGLLNLPFTEVMESVTTDPSRNVECYIDLPHLSVCPRCVRKGFCHRRPLLQDVSEQLHAGVMYAFRGTWLRGGCWTKIGVPRILDLEREQQLRQLKPVIPPNIG